MNFQCPDLFLPAKKMFFMYADGYSTIYHDIIICHTIIGIVSTSETSTYHHYTNIIFHLIHLAQPRFFWQNSGNSLPKNLPKLRGPGIRRDSSSFFSHLPSLKLTAQFAPENPCLQDDPASFWGLASPIFQVRIIGC